MLRAKLLIQQFTVLVLYPYHTFEKKSPVDPPTTISLKLPAYLPLTFPHIGTDTMFVLLCKTTSIPMYKIYLMNERTVFSSIAPFLCFILNFPYPAGSCSRDILKFIQFYKNK